MNLFSKKLRAILIVSPLVFSAQSALAQAVTDATFADGCNGSAKSVGGTIESFIDYIDKSTTKTCIVGDKVYSNFTFDNFVIADAFLQIGQPGVDGLSHSLKVSDVNGLMSTSPYKLKYDISVVSPSTLFIDTWRTTTEIMDLDTSKFTLTTSTLTPNPSSFSIVFPTAQNSPTIDLSGTPTTLTFENILNVTPGAEGLNGFTNTVRQAAPSSKVPGPLPLLGVGAAFGLSRKLRVRIKTTA